jgi:hypothetical protein
MTLGIAFAKGKGFIDLALPGSYHFLWWPPGFPLFIALFYKLFGPQWFVLKLLLFFSLYLSLFLYALMLYKEEKNHIKPALVLTAICFSSGIHLLSSYLYSEIFFIICSLLFFFLWFKWHKSLTVLKVVTLSLFALYISMIRLIGISLPLALSIHLLFFTKKKGGSRWYCIIPGVLLISYISISLLFPPLRIGSLCSALGFHVKLGSTITGANVNGTASFIQIIKQYINKIINCLRGYGLSLIPQAVIRSTYDSFTMSKLKALIMMLVTGVIITGWAASFRKIKLMHLYVAVYIVILIIYGPLYVRLLVPIIPFLFLYLYSGCELVINVLIKNKRYANIVLIVLWLGIVYDNALRTFTDPHRTMPAQFGDGQFQSCIEWIVNNAKPKEVVVSQVHSYMYLRRGQYCIPYFGAKTANEFITYLDENNAKYIVVSPFYQRPHYTYMNSTREAVKTYPEKFNKVFGDESARSYVLEYYSHDL